MIIHARYADEVLQLKAYVRAGTACMSRLTLRFTDASLEKALSEEQARSPQSLLRSVRRTAKYRRTSGSRLK